MRQKEALDILKAGRNVYLTGPAGSGKTHTLRAYIEYLKHRSVTVGLTASTGIASTHIGGVTIHSWSGIGIKDGLSEYDIDALTQKEKLVKRFRDTQVLIIDEISMLTAYFFDSLDTLARAMRQNDAPFGGMQVVLSGDFFQLPPITRGSTVEFVYQSSVWKQMDIRVCYLEEQHRQESDDVLRTLLEEMRSGEVSELSFEELQSCIDNDPGRDWNPTRLFTHNVDVDELNAKELELLPGNGVVFHAVSKGKAKLVEAIKKGMLAPEVLVLKKNAQVMFVRNNYDAGYVNGTLGMVVDFEQGEPVVEKLDGTKIKVPLETWAIEEDGKVLAQVSQYPLRLAWAITVHKSQGMTLDSAEVDLSKAFVPGQGYVALSRVRSIKGLYLKGINPMALQVNPNIVEFDIRLRSESRKWAQVIGRFESDQIEGFHIEFMKKVGGITDEKEIEKNKNAIAEPIKKKVATHIQTKELFEAGHTLDEIAEIRDMTLGTIVGHIEKALERGHDIDIKRLKPDTKTLNKIKKALKESKDGKLAPIHKKLNGEFSYEAIRIARLFIK